MKWWVLSVPGTDGNFSNGQRDKAVMATRVSSVKAIQLVLTKASSLIILLFSVFLSIQLQIYMAVAF
jgi:hypothetical protein